MRNPTNRLTIFTLALALLLLPTGLHATVPAPIAPEIVSPGEIDVAVEVATACPTFSWTSVPGAASVELVVYDLPEGVESGALPSDPVLSRELPGGASTWTPSAAECLTGGHGYAWSVGAQTDGNAMAWSDVRVFRVSESSASELEQALERVLNRFVEQRRLDEATAAAIQADPSRILGPPHLGVEDATPLASAPILAAADSIAIQGAATGTLDSELTWGVVGTTEAGAENSAGVLGISDHLSSANKKYGVLGVAADSNLESAGVGGQGKTGVLGVGDTSKNGIGVIGIASDTLTVASAGVGVKVGVVGIGDEIGVQGKVDSSTGVAGDFRNLSGEGLVVQGGGGQADIRMVTGLVDVMSGELTLGAGDKFVGTFDGDGTALTGVVASNTDTLDNLDSTQFLRSDQDDVYEGGNTLTIVGTLGFAAAGIFDATAMTGSGNFKLPTCVGCVTGGGTDSGLDADKLDGIQSTGFARLGLGNAGTLLITDGTESDNKDTGSIVTDGGLGVEKNISIGGKVRLKNGDLFSNETGTEILLEEGGGPNALLIDLRDANGGVVLKGDNEDVGAHSGIRFTVQSEEAVGTGNRGGDLFLTAGTGGGGNSIGGNVEIIGGTGTGTSQGGDIVLQPGRTGAGTAGRVKIEGSALDLNSSPSADLAVSIVARQSSVANGMILYDPMDAGVPGNPPAWNISPALDLSGATPLVLPTTGISGAGSGSGLDADRLDNKDSSAFLSLPLSGDLAFSEFELIGQFIDEDGNQEVDATERNVDKVLSIGENAVNPDPGPTEPSKYLAFDLRSVDEIIIAADQSNTTAHAGTALTITAEDAVGTSVGGNLSLSAGKGGVNRQGGDLALGAGRALSDSESPGTSGRGGDLSVTAGTGGGSQRGGQIQLTAGAGDASAAGAGGSITLQAGDATGSTAGGDIILLPGSGSPAGTVNITGTVNATAFVGDGAGLTNVPAGSLGIDSVSTLELDDGSDNPSDGDLVVVADASAKEFGYQTLSGGSGIVYTSSSPFATGSISTASEEASFLADGGTTSLTCSSSQGAGSMQVMDDGSLEYCDGANTPVLRAGSLAPVVDSTAIVKGSGDATKKARFEVDGVTTGTTRVITIPNKDITLDDDGDSRPPSGTASGDLGGSYPSPTVTAVQTGAIAQIADIASGLRTGADTDLVTGTAGSNGNLLEWNSDGDAVDSSIPATDVIRDGEDGSIALGDGGDVVTINDVLALTPINGSQPTCSKGALYADDDEDSLCYCADGAAWTAVVGATCDA